MHTAKTPYVTILSCDAVGIFEAMMQAAPRHEVKLKQSSNLCSIKVLLLISPFRRIFIYIIYHIAFPFRLLESHIL